MPYTDDTLREEFENWIKTANPDLAPHQTKYLVADYFISKFHKYQAYLIEQGEGMALEKRKGWEQLDEYQKIVAIAEIKAIEDYQNIIRGK